MRFLRVLLPAAIVAGSFASAPSAAAAGTTISVTSTAPSPGSASDCTLGEAIDAANSNTAVDACAAGTGDDVISLPSGTYSLTSVDHTTPDGPVALPEIESNITIDGANAQDTIIQRATGAAIPAFDLFHMDVSTENQCWPSCTITIMDVTVQDAVGVGGVITNNLGRTVFDNVTLAGNKQGPAISTSGRLTVRNSFVTNNASTGNGGVINAQGNVTITNTPFSSNSGGSGGVLYFGAASTATITNSTFEMNSATTGAAIAGAGTLNVTGSNFKTNSTFGGNGGAIATSGTVTVVNSWFFENYAGGGDGGGIASTGSLDVERTTFEGNAADNNGGGIAAQGSSTVIANSTFAANIAGIQGGGFYASGGASTVSNSTFSENFGGTGGGFAWDQNGGSIALQNSLIAGNTADISPDCSSATAIVSQGYNLVADGTGCSLTAGSGDQIGTTLAPINPLLGVLDTHGGTTKTFALLDGSPAIDTANPAAPGGGGTTCEQFDQRNQARPRDGDSDGTFRCDIGAYENGVGLPLLTTEKDGTGTGLVETASDGTIVCGDDCAETFTPGTSVILVATPTADAEFEGWVGCDSVVGDQCTVSMTNDKTVIATFTDVQSVLSVTRTGSGQGSVSSSPGGIDCGLDCNELYPYGTTITLTAQPASNSNFHFWSGCDSTNGTTCTFTLDEDRSVFASFSPIVRTLTVNKPGSGSGTVTSDPEGIDCGSDCNESYQIGSEITLTAVVGANSEFGGWSGCDTAVGLTCTVTVNNHQAVSASFTPAQRQLDVTKVGSGGTITSSPAGINCPGDCSNSFDEGSSVTLTANPDPNVELTSWTGCTTSTATTCTVTMDGAESVSGTFAPIQRSLNVSRSGTGAGTVSSVPAGINCGSDCDQSYDHGTSVTLTAAPAEGSTLQGWTGCESSTGNGCTVSMFGTQNVTASFALIPRTLTVAKAGTGSGTVSSAPAGINCGSDCTETYGHGTSVTLTATPGVDSAVSGWSGCDSVDGATCTVTMNGAENVTVAFGPLQRDLSVSKTGNGTGTVSTYSNTGIDCGADCTETYDHGENVTLKATPANGSAFVSWTGCDSSTDEFCDIQMNRASSVTASFSSDPQALDVVIESVSSGTGSVGSDLPGIDCGIDCSELYAPSSVVTLTPSAGLNSAFQKWENCPRVDPQTDTCTVTIDRAHEVTAFFTPSMRTLTVTSQEAGNADDFLAGTLSFDLPVDYDCAIALNTACGDSYFHGTSVTMTADLGVDPLIEVVQWQGCDSSTATTCTVAMNSDKEVTVTIGRIRRSVDVATSGTGIGSVSSDPVGIDCGSDCTQDYVKGETIRLTATAGANSFFVGWTGCDSVNGAVCTITGSDAERDVTAAFGLVSRTLTVTRTGTFKGTVSSSPAGIDCGSDCTQSYEHGTSVVMTAVDGTNSVFAGWTGCDLSDGNTCTVTMDGVKGVTAAFTPAQRALSVTTVGTGSVSSAPAGIDCGSDCTQDYGHGTSVTLTATTASDSAFESWTGCDTAAGTQCTIAMNGVESVTATFTSEPRTLTVSRDGTGVGTVSSVPTGINCGTTCSNSFGAGSSVTLTASPGDNSTFVQWTGCDSTSGADCTVAMSANRSPKATFGLVQRSLTVQSHRASGDSVASGRVTSDIGGINCAITQECQGSFAHGTQVVLTAIPSAGNVFSGWTGCDNASGDTCTMTANSAKTVTAQFHNTAVPSSNVAPAPQDTNSTTRTFGFQASGGSGAALTSVELWIDGPGAGGFQKVADKTGSASEGTFNPVELDEGDGRYVVVTRARNAAGNYEALKGGNGFSLDTSAPTSSVAAPAESRVNALELTWSASGQATDVELWADGPGVGGPAMADSVAPGGSGSGTFTFGATEGAGSYSFYSIAEDTLGNREGAPGSPDAVVNVILCPGLESDPRLHIVGTAGNDKLVGTDAPEVICGEGGNDLITGKGGADLMTGGAGKDTVSYKDRSAKMPVVVTVNNKVNDGQANEGDSVGDGIENVIGGAGKDLLIGDKLANKLKGGLGNDTLKGGAGNDKLYGEGGKDKLDGGTKKDVCKTGETLIGCEVT